MRRRIDQIATQLADVLDQRAVDAHNVVRYLQITPELAQLPDLDEAFKFARSLVTAS